MLCCRSCQRERRSISPRAMLYHFLPCGVQAISIFYQFIQFLGTVIIGRREWMLRLSSSLPFISLLTQQSILRASICACLPSSSAPPPPPCSRGGRPVSAGPIGKQRPKIYLPVSSPSSTSKHSNGSRKNAVGPQFLSTMNSITTTSRPPPRKFDKSQNL